MVTIYFCRLKKRIPPDIIRVLQKEVPKTVRQRILRYKRWQNRQALLVGRLILKKELMQKGFDEDCLDNISQDNYGRPSIGQSVDFNISYSFPYIVCVVCDKARVGIDIEKITEIQARNFRNYMAPIEWDMVLAAENKNVALLHLWTRKEAVCKADGRGLSIPLESINVAKNEVFIDRCQWNLKKINISRNSICHLAYNKTIQEFRISEVNPAQILKSTY